MIVYAEAWHGESGGWRSLQISGRAGATAAIIRQAEVFTECFCRVRVAKVNRQGEVTVLAEWRATPKRIQ